MLMTRSSGASGAASCELRGAEADLECVANKLYAEELRAIDASNAVVLVIAAR